MHAVGLILLFRLRSDHGRQLSWGGVSHTLAAHDHCKVMCV
jgi:hypothetical protein